MSPKSHPRPIRPMAAAPLLSFELGGQVTRLKAESEWRADGRNAITLVKQDDLRVVLIVLQRDLKLDEHHAAGPFTLQVITGRVVLRAAEKSVEVAAGGLLVVSSMLTHEVEALEESAFLLTILHPTKGMPS